MERKLFAVKLLKYEEKFYEWSRKHGVVWKNINYDRSTGGKVSALQIRHAATPERRALVIVCHATGNDKLYPLTHSLRILLSAGLDVFTFDLDGHGRFSSTALDPLHYDSMISEALVHVEELPAYRAVHLYGHSFGAALVLDFLKSPVKKPGNLSAAVCMAMPFRIHQGPRTWLPELKSPLLPTFWRRVPEYGLTGIWPALGPFKRTIYPVRLPAAGDRKNHFAYASIVTKIIQDMDLMTTAASVHYPVLIVSGEGDAIAPCADSRILAHVLPHATLVPLENENHFSMLLSKEAVLQAVHWLHTQ